MKSAESRIQRHLESYRDWSKDTSVDSCILVQYSGPEMTGSIEVKKEQIEEQIEGCTSEGFDVFWNQKNDVLFLCVIESWTQPIPWNKVFKKEDFIDIEAIMKEGGIE